MNLLKTMRLHPVITGAVTVIAAVATIAGATYAWGPSRQLYTMAHPADHPTFDSITDNPNYGDERGFTTVKDVTANGNFSHNTQLIPGHEYMVQIYIHNDASETLNASGAAIAHDVAARAALSATIDGSDTVDGFITSSNADPKLIYDSATLTSTGKVTLEYIKGSAMLYTNHQTANLSDSVITTGVTVGSHDLSGNWLGCLDSAGYLRFKFKVPAPTPPPVVDKDITVCEVNSGNIKTIKQSEYDAHPSLYADKNSDKCKVKVCDINSGSVITIQNDEYNAHKDKYASSDSDKCKTITVCELSTKTVKTINKDTYNSNTSLYADQDSTTCHPVAVTATELPHTGIEGVFGLVGAGALTYAGYAYIASRRA